MRKEIFSRQNWMSQKLPHNYRCFIYIFLELLEFLFDFIKVFKPMRRIRMQKLNNNINHIVRYDIIVKKWWHFKNIILRGIQVQFIFLDMF